MSRAAAVGAEYSNDIQGASERFGDHEGMSPERVLNWMLQFADEDLPLARKILQEVAYFNSTNLRELSRQMIQIVMAEIQGATPDATVFVPISQQPGGGAETIARILRGLQHPFRPRVTTMVNLQGMRPDDVDVLTFVDDFSGTGDTLAAWWETVEPLVRPLAARLVIAAPLMTVAAAERTREVAASVGVVELDEASNVLSDANGVFDNGEKDKILEYCEKTGSSGRLVRGYGDCGLLLALRHGCPNNSLPILWYGDKGWETLFLRRAI